jgi:hypothetical protein
MKTTDAIQHFGSRPKLAAALNIKAPSVYCWGPLVPIGRAYQLQHLTNGVLKVDASLYNNAKAA